MTETKIIAIPSDLAGVAKTAADLGRAAKSENTRRAYKADWQRFIEWCAGRRLQAMPADPVTVGLFIADVSAGKAGLAPSTVKRILAGICAEHRAKGVSLDRRHLAIADVLKGLRRTKRRPVKQANPILPDLLLRLVAACGEDLRGLRDRALILLGFAGALRRSELVAIDLEHLTESKEGYRLTLPWSKTDQEGEGAILGIPRGRNGLCPVVALKDWLAMADIEAGPIFAYINRWDAVERGRLTPQSVSLIVKRRAADAGLTRAEIAALSSHSLRAGFVTAAYDKDLPEPAIQRHVRHKNADTTRGYNRVISAFKGNPAKSLLE